MNQNTFNLCFNACFKNADKANGRTNFVKLSTMRESMAAYTHDEFNSGLRQLRVDGTYSLDSHEGLHGSLSQADRDAAILEAGSRYVYVSLR